MGLAYPPEAPCFRPAFWLELAATNPLGLELSARAVKDWFYLEKWPRYRTYGYRRHAVMVTRWWSRVTPGELRRAALLRAELEAGPRPLVVVPPPIEVDEQPQEAGPRQGQGLLPLETIFAQFAK